MKKRKTGLEAEASVAPVQDSVLAVAAPAAVPSAVAVVMIGLEHLSASKSNPRRTMNEADLAELAASIKEHGVSVPLLVRYSWRSVWVEFEDGSSDSMLYASMAERSELLRRPGALRTEVEDGYEIVCGHRRSEAATLAGLTEVPCIVRELTDEQAAEIALIDNLQRVDVPPLEEAEAFGELLDRLLSIAAVAAKVGKEQSYVAKRLKLRTLTVWSRDALRYQLISIDHALLLCRLAEAEQNEALKWCLDHSAGSKVKVEDVIAQRLGKKSAVDCVTGAPIAGADEDADLEDEDDDDDGDEDEDDGVVRRPWGANKWEPQTVQRLKSHIESESGTPLDRAPWPLDETHLNTEAGACLDCPKNTKANAPLFGDLDINNVAICTDGACFRDKTAAFVRIQSRTSEGTQTPLRVSWKMTSTAPRMEKDGSGPNPAQTFKGGQWEEATKKCEHARPAVTVDWSDANNRGHMGGGKLRGPGELLQVCIAPKCKAHPKDWEKAAKGSGGPRGQAGESWEQRQKREEEELKAFEAIESPIRRALYDAIAAKISADQVKRLVLEGSNAAGVICRATGFESDNWNKRQKHAADLIEKAKGVDLDKLLFHAVRGLELDVSRSEIAAPDHGRGELRNLAKLVGVAADAVERRAARAAEDVKASADAVFPLQLAQKATAKKSAQGAGKTSADPAKKKPVLSAADKKRIADAQQRRWAAAKKTTAKPAAKKAAKKGGK